MKDYSKQSFFKLTFRFLTIFFVVILLIKLFISLFTGEIAEVSLTSFTDGTAVKFLSKYLLMSLVYGIFMAGYYKFIKK